MVYESDFLKLGFTLKKWWRELNSELNWGYRVMIMIHKGMSNNVQNSACVATLWNELFRPYPYRPLDGRAHVAKLLLNSWEVSEVWILIGKSGRIGWSMISVALSELWRQLSFALRCLGEGANGVEVLGWLMAHWDFWWLVLILF